MIPMKRQKSLWENFLQGGKYQITILNFTTRSARRSLPLRAPLGTRDILLSHIASKPPSK